MTQELGMTEKDLIQARKNKLEKLKELGIDPYPSISGRSSTIAVVIEKFTELEKSKEPVCLAGRVFASRGHGKLVFLDLVDESGKVQVVMKADFLGEAFSIVPLIDLGDFVEVTGPVFRTNSGEISVESREVKFLVKAIRPMPEKWHGLKDPETRYRERYTDLMVNEEVKAEFYKRSKIIQKMRSFLLDMDFMEVDTPVLQSIAGGATAKPFVTFYNAYERDVYLRIAPELFLKRLLVGGYEKVFEFARCFRNEGVDATHNPEFTNLEFYWAYVDYEKMMGLVEKMIREVVKEINNGSLEMDIYGHKIDFSKPFEKKTFEEISGGKNTDEAFKEGITKTINPTFVINHPVELLPLAKKNVANPKVVDSFQLIIGGLELAKAFSELNDPIDQRERFLDQMKLREKGDEEAQALDEDFLKAIEYGMPPTSGCGIGIDRLVRALTDSQTLREIIFFPFMKPIKDQPKKEVKE